MRLRRVVLYSRQNVDAHFSAQLVLNSVEAENIVLLAWYTGTPLPKALRSELAGPSGGVLYLIGYQPTTEDFLWLSTLFDEYVIIANHPTWDQDPLVGGLVQNPMTTRIETGVGMLYKTDDIGSRFTAKVPYSYLAITDRSLAVGTELMLDNQARSPDTRFLDDFVTRSFVLEDSSACYWKHFADLTGVTIANPTEFVPASLVEPLAKQRPVLEYSADYLFYNGPLYLAQIADLVFPEPQVCLYQDMAEVRVYCASVKPGAVDTGRLLYYMSVSTNSVPLGHPTGSGTGAWFFNPIADTYRGVRLA